MQDVPLPGGTGEGIGNLKLDSTMKRLLFHGHSGARLCLYIVVASSLLPSGVLAGDRRRERPRPPEHPGKVIERIGGVFFRFANWLEGNLERLDSPYEERVWPPPGRPVSRPRDPQLNAPRDSWRYLESDTAYRSADPYSNRVPMDPRWYSLGLAPSKKPVGSAAAAGSQSHAENKAVTPYIPLSPRGLRTLPANNEPLQPEGSTFRPSPQPEAQQPKTTASPAITGAEVPKSKATAGKFDSVPVATKTDKPNRVKSPHPPNRELDVTGFTRGDLARDPTTGKMFRVP